MKRIAVIVTIFIVVCVALYVYFRQRETYVLPNVTGSPSEMCPDGYVLACVSKQLDGIEEVVPFPSSLPNPCPDPDFPAFPLCLPDPKHIRPPTKQYNKKS